MTSEYLAFDLSEKRDGDVVLSFDTPKEAKTAFKAMRSFDNTVRLEARPFKVLVRRERWPVLFSPYTSEIVGNRRYFVMREGRIVTRNNPYPPIREKPF